MILWNPTYNDSIRNLRATLVPPNTVDKTGVRDRDYTGLEKHLLSIRGRVVCKAFSTCLIEGPG